MEGSTASRALLLGGVMGIGLLTKTTCVLLYPLALIAFVLVWRRKPSDIRHSVGHLLGAFAVSLIIGGWWLVRNYFLYGDPFAMAEFGRAFGHTAKPEYWYSQGLSVAQYWMLVIGWTFASFWGVFGHMKVFMPTWAYIGLAAVVGLVKAGVLLRRSADDGTTDEIRGVLLVYAVLVALVALSFVSFNTRYFQAQGRYLYPAILPFAVYWVLGVRRLLPARMNGWTPAITSAVPLAAQIIALITCVVGGNG
jgi:4-amino-4-deoxy-L-arabinose transferase-like glycosyltransferase